MDETFLIIGGIFNSLLTVFHITFWRNPTFNWKEEIPKLNLPNQGILQVANLMLIYVLACFAAFSFLLLSLQPFSMIEKTIIVVIGGFYLVRAGLQYPFFGASKISTGLFTACLLIAACYFGILL